MLSHTNPLRILFKLYPSLSFLASARKQQKLAQLHIHSCLDLQIHSLGFLQQHFGKFGLSLHDYCRGIDKRIVNPDRVRKSVSVEQTFDHDLVSLEQCIEQLQLLYQKLRLRIKGYESRITGIFVKITDTQFYKHSIERHSRFYTFALYSGLFIELYQQYQQPIRLLGLGVRLSNKEHKQLELMLE